MALEAAAAAAAAAEPPRALKAAAAAAAAAELARVLKAAAPAAAAVEQPRSLPGCRWCCYAGGFCARPKPRLLWAACCCCFAQFWLGRLFCCCRATGVARGCCCRPGSQRTLGVPHRWRGLSTLQRATSPKRVDFGFAVEQPGSLEAAAAAQGHSGPWVPHRWRGLSTLQRATSPRGWTLACPVLVGETAAGGRDREGSAGVRWRSFFPGLSAPRFTLRLRTCPEVNTAKVRQSNFARSGEGKFAAARKGVRRGCRERLTHGSKSGEVRTGEYGGARQEGLWATALVVRRQRL